MRINSRLVRISTLVAIGFMVTSAVSAYSLLNPARKWLSTPRTVFVDQGGLASVTTPDHGVSATLSAVMAWNNAPGGSAINITSSTSGAPTFALGDGRSQLIFSDPPGVCTGTCIAATFTGYYTSSQTGTCGALTLASITDADIVYNLAYNYSTEAEDPGGAGCSSEISLESVTTHEVGHLIGLAHSNVSSALMAATLSYCVNKPLATDDTNGRNALYSCSGTCKAAGQICTANSNCCSNSCKGKPGAKTCR